MAKRYCWGCDEEVEMESAGEEGLWFCDKEDCGCVFDDYSDADRARHLTAHEVEAGEIC